MAKAAKPNVAKQYRVLLSTSHESNAKVFVVTEGVGRAGKAVRIKAEQGARYELQDDTKGKGLAPDQVRVKRMGKNLGLMFDRSQSVDVVIEGYYDAAAGSQASVVGMAENGEMYSYVPHDPEAGSLINNLRDGGVPVQMSLGGEAVAAFELAGLPVVAAGGVNGWAVAGGAAAAGAAGGGGGSGGSSPSSAPAPEPPPVPNANVNAAVSITAISQDTAPAGAASDLGSVHDFITNDNTLSYSGTLSNFTANGAKVRVVLKNNSGAEVASADVTPDMGVGGHATWTWNDESVARADGKYTLVASLVDASGAVIKAGVSQEVWISANGLTAQDDAGAAKEAGGLNNDVAGQDATGNVLTNDSATSGLGIKVLSHAAGNYGTLTLAADGSYTYAVNNNNAAVNGLSDGQTLTDAIEYTVVDTTGLTKTATLRITITGVTDTNPNVNAILAITAISDDTASSFAAANDFWTSDNTLSYSGTLSGFTDNGASVLLELKNSLGVLVKPAVKVVPTLGSAGDATWVWSDEHHGLTDGRYTLVATLLDANDVPIKMGVAQEIWVSQNGLQAVDDAALATEEGANATGNVLTNDSTLGSTSILKRATAQTTQGKYGSLTLNTDGSYVYTLQNGTQLVQNLRGARGTQAADALTDEAFTYTVQDATGQSKTGTLRIRIEGTNDQAVFDGLYVLDMRKTATLPSIASLGVSDIDTNESSFVVPDTLIGAYGDFSFTANTWSYGVVASRAAVVDASAEYHDILVVTSLDGSATKTLDVKVLSDVASVAGAPKVFNLLNTEGVTVEGGAGVSDKLVLLGAGQTLDLTRASTQVTHIERMDLTGSGNNTVKLNLASLTQADVGSDGVHQLYIDGNSGDSVHLVLPASHQSVQADSTVQGYQRYVLDATHELLISQAIANFTTS
jgi:VCBS repeat-containing protein